MNVQKTAGRVLKSNQVQFEGRVQLTLPSRANRTGGSAATSPAQQVRIVENTPEYALIEIACCCGTKTYVKCEYAAAETRTT